MNNDTTLCPYCREIIKREAIRCKHCQAALASSPGGGSYNTTGASFGVTVGGSGHTITGGINLTLGELEQVDPSQREKLRKEYEDKVRNLPDQPQYHFALGLCYLDLRLYDLSINHLRRALGKTTEESKILYYLALASLRGRRPRVQGLTTIRAIEGYLRAALQLDDRPAHYKLLWAIIKQDYYLMNGLRIDPPGIEELCSTIDGSGIDVKELRSMLDRLAIPASPLTNAISNLVRRS
jgi:tetratricopeptide (TPR) repeat protein